MRYPERQKAGGGTWICAFFFLSALVVFCFLSLLRTVAQAAFTHDFSFFFSMFICLGHGVLGRGESCMNGCMI